MAYGAALLIALREHLEGMFQVGDTFSKSFFVTVRALAL